MIVVVGEWRNVLQIQQFRPLDGLLNRQRALGLFGQGSDQRCSNHDRFARFAIGTVSVVELRIDGRKLVARQCPWRCGPDDQRSVFDTFEREANVNAWVSNFAIALSDFASS